MKFYNREREIERLHEIRALSLENAQFTVVTGRRRVGKTQLLLQAYKDEPTLYFFVSRKAEPFLCRDFQQEISDKLGVPMLGEIREFSKIFQFLMQISAKQHFTLLIDEFQEFLRINPAVFSDMQHFWDIYKDKSKINLLVCGSVYSLMHKIFEDYKAPLFGRATQFLHVKPFKVAVLKEILVENAPDFSSDDLLALYAFTGGVVKYVQLLVDSKAFTKNKMLNYAVREDSPFITDGKNMLVEEFGKDYTIYFTILSAISRGENTRGQIENTVGSEVGGYLARMEHDYGLITKQIPIFAKSETKNVRYTIEDNYLTFWFRFIYKYSHVIEIAQFGALKQIIERDYATFSGKILERYFREKLLETGNFTRIGSYWDRTGQNEIDLVAVNELSKTAIIAEIKRNEQHIRYNALKEKAENMLAKTGSLKDYSVAYQGLSLADM
ncbi:MAG: ATP-binding protein [Prevotellaceae bacterium]|jgi:AAA+ ATPase superfamily predicted ATPase|nr:ATP-binding protein [Prevotellaceae bacterium]